MSAEPRGLRTILKEYIHVIPRSMQRAQTSHHAMLANAFIIQGQGKIGAFLYSVRLSLLAE